MPVIFFRALLKPPHTLGQNARDFFSSPLWTPVAKKTIVDIRCGHPLWTPVEGIPLKALVLTFRLAVTPRGQRITPGPPK